MIVVCCCRFRIPDVHCERYAQNIVHKLCDTSIGEGDCHSLLLVFAGCQC